MQYGVVMLGGKAHKIDEHGNVYKRRSKIPPHTRKVFPDKYGYLKIVSQDCDGVSCNYYIHLLVYTTFVGQVPEGFTVDHIDSDKTNNHYSNFQLLTAEENAIKGNAKAWKFVSPSGEVVEIYNLKQFCKDNGLQDSHMNKVFCGRKGYLQHKGWTKYYET